MPIYKDEVGTKDGRKYYFIDYYTDSKGQRKQFKSKKYASPEEVKKAESRFLLNINEFDVNDLYFHDISDEYIEDYKKKNKPSSYYANKKRIEKHIKNNFDKKISKINNNDLDNFKKYLDKHIKSNEYKNSIILRFKAIIKFAKKKYDIMTNLNEKIDYYSTKSDPKRNHNFWTYEEWKEFNNILDDIEYKTLFNLLYFCGLRKGEALALNWNDIKENKIIINKSLTYKVYDKLYEITDPKTKNSFREVSIPNKVVELINQLRKQNMKYTDFKKDWFIFGNIRPLPLTTMQRKFKYYTDKSNVKKIRIHDLRHSHVSLLINNGCDEREVADRLGHTVDMVRNVYSHMFPERRDRLLETLNKLD